MKYYLSPYKGGGSAQGIAMQQFIKASTKQLALTGTIAGGYANDLFYLLYRLDPQRMKDSGYSYSLQGEKKFVQDYGTLESKFEVMEGNETYNTASKGRILEKPKCKPGISPLIYARFLLDRAVFLDITDMSNQLPQLKEEVIPVPLEPEIRTKYEEVRRILKKAIKTEAGKTLLGSFLQFSLSYTDKPYDREPILSPITGRVVAKPGNIRVGDNLLNKEQALIQRLNLELKENRNVVIYAEFTSSPSTNIAFRLQEIIMKHCRLKEHEVCVLQSGYPSSEKREEWIHKMAEKGARVIITNPRLTETGLDFCFEYNGRLYNYPTIINYQLGYSLYVVLQSNYRHYRLNQVVECRTIYIVSEQTIQIDCIELIANKQVATQVLQGKLSSEGLAALANGVDSRVALTQAFIEENQKERIQNLRNTFKKLNGSRKNIEKKEVELMLTYAELTGLNSIDNKVVLGTDEESLIYQLFPGLFDMVDNPGIEEKEVGSQVELPAEEVWVRKKKLKQPSKKVDAQMSLFDLL